MQTFNLESCHLVNLPKISDPRGNLTSVEAGKHIPFELKRVYYLYDVPEAAERGGHAHKSLHQLMIAASGAFEIELDDGRERKSYHLNRPDLGLYLCPMVWREIKNFSAGALCLVLASDVYDEDDYIRDYAGFVSASKAHKTVS